MSVRRQLTRTDCYHGNIGRKNAEEELRKSIYEVGTFLIRSSTDKPNYALSLKSPLKQSIAHYLILWHGPIYQPFYSIEGGPLFPNISQLISFYTRSNEGLPCTLGFSVISNPMPRLQQPPAYPETLIDKIHVAAFAGDLTTIQELVSLNPNCVNIRNAMQCTPLHVACLCCHENVVIELLKAKADVDAVDIRGYTPLMYAATVGHTTICQKLLNDGANLAQRSPVTGRYALHEVAMRGYHNCLQLLLDRGAPLLATSYDNKTPLDIARFWNREECCNILDRESKRETGTMDGDWLHQDISDEVKFLRFNQLTDHARICTKLE
ncbi:uncharacterized protein TRIADDRAFT_59641 [Trichoplax adhaerens]|uniref:SH2 domain-containing protein n=1 Tax=Trichoplax adhaerens TaxID=10228 RepID=B3S5N2_TRIAD|nr:hypothetical protein TRIADDRAFT_59641 [Trichoplax adhaerens]EDV21929.1 hypothetical protein TRIADDRAFT_59641 [Trichoplax adhaerens]|eukprot:XP_002115566.1 hypothetical protein TRIADDRAFT_59641 [Trichoplax adhaerens]